MPRPDMTPELMGLVAERFRVLGEPARLGILACLRDGEQTVSQLAAGTGLSQANLSKHLQLLHATGFVRRRREGLFVHYALAGADIFRLCDIMCGRLAAEAKARDRALARRSTARDR